MACLRLSLLGSFEAKLDGEPVTGFPTSKIQALLAYLAVEAHRAHRREVLAALLWPDWPERAARTNLRNALSKLRTAIGDRAAMGDRQAGAGACQPYLLVTRETVQFNVDSDHWLDVAAFRDLAAAATDRGGDAACDRLQRAIALYRGPFLEGFGVGDSRSFEDWAFLVRERLQRRVLAALQRLIGHCERRGEVARASELAWRWVELAPWQERAHRALMRCLALSGQRSAALAQYETCCRALKEELDVEPGAETRRLYERICNGELTPAPQKVPAQTRAPPAGVPAMEWPPEEPPAVVSEPASGPAAAASVEAPVAAKRSLPGWVWGLIGAMGTLVLLIVAGVALLVPRGEGRSPSPEATTTPIATPTSPALVAVTSAPPAVLPAGIGHIAGTVTDESGAPIAGIAVDCCEESVPPDMWGSSIRCNADKTDEHGDYAIPDLAPGSYRVVIWNDPFYFPEFYGDALTHDDAALVPVTGGQTTPGIDFALANAGTIAGTVTDESGTPIAGIWVDSCEENVPDKLWGLSILCRNAQTDENGDYTIPQLTPGRYRVAIWSKPFYFHEYYDNVLTTSYGEQPDLVPVTGGAITPDVDFALAAAGHITGTVVDRSGTPVAGLWVEACEEGVPEELWGTSSLCGNAVTDEYGIYSIPQLPPGKYRLVVRGDPSFAGGYHDHASAYHDADLVHVTGGGTTAGIDFALAPATPKWVEPQEGKYVDLCKDVTPPQICVRDVKTGQVTQVTSDLDFGCVGGPGWSPDGQQILFDAGANPEVTGQWDNKLYLIQVKEPLPSAERSDLRQITSGDTTDLDPAWSPDGQWIAFHRNCGLWIVRPDGTGAQMLLAGTETLCTNWPAWSSDSQQIAFSNVRAPFIEVWVIDADGGDPHVVYTFERRLEWGSPGWSPDGRQIACWYTDGREEKSLLIYLDGSDNPQTVDQLPRWWFRNFWPQWGSETEAPLSRVG